MSDKIPTAEQFLKNLDEESGTTWTEDDESICKALKEFAKLHVEAALKAADKKTKELVSEQNLEEILDEHGDLEFIFKAYPLTKIK